MTKEEYFKYAIKNRFLSKIEWIYSMFTKPLSNTKYIKIKDNKYFLLLDGKEEEVNLENDLILNTALKITLTKDDLINIDKPIETTIGKAFVNYILLVTPFKNKIGYTNDLNDFNKLHEHTIIPMMSNEEGPELISIKEYQMFGNALAMIRSLADIFVISSTEKAILPPDGIKEFKKKKIAEYKAKYGEDVFKNRSTYSRARR